MHNDPTHWTGVEWLLVMSVSLFGGLINWLQKIRDNNILAFNVLVVIGELCTAGFVGFLSFAFLAGLSINVGLSAGISGTMAHLSTRALVVIQNAILKKIEQKINGL
jgi:CHASE2 domain-containing sensor protein